jgi:hypothetical protein
MSAVLTRALAAALATPVGASLAQVLHAPFVTVLLADRDGGPDALAALAVARDALARAGIAPGRQMVLLASEGPALAEPKARAREWRAALGLPVVIHDPARAAWSPFGEVAGVPLLLDDELREAEAVVAVSALRPHARGVARGGSALLVPGVAAPATRAAWLAPVADHIVTAGFRVDFALCWDGDDPARAWAGAAPRVWEHAIAAPGWRVAPASG